MAENGTIGRCQLAVLVSHVRQWQQPASVFALPHHGPELCTSAQ
jgi:hypothetical protein